MEKSIKIPPEKQKYLEGLDRSILQWSVQHARLCIQADSAKNTIATLYQSHSNQINEQLQEAGVNPLLVLGAKYNAETGEITVELKDPVPEAAPSPNGS